MIYRREGYVIRPVGRSVVAQRFDEASLRLAGPPLTILPVTSAMLGAMGDNPYVSFSDNGLFVYGLVEHPRTRFVWVDRTGRELATVAEPGPYRTFDLSPDDRRLAVSTIESNGYGANIRSFDLVRGGWTRLSFAAEYYSEPRWLDATRVLAWRTAYARSAIVRLGPDGEETTLDVPAGCILDNVSVDGRRLLCRPYPLRPFSTQRLELHAVAVDGSAPSEVVQRIPATHISDGQFSPDGQYVAFSSNVSGRPEVYVTRVGAPDERWAVTTAGGVQPRWRADARELFVIDLDGNVQSVEVVPEADGRLRFSTPVVLFDAGVRPLQAARQVFAASRDGQRFLLLVPVELRARRSVGVIHDWLSLVRAAEPIS